MSELDEKALEAAVRAGYAAWMLSPWVGIESPEPFDETVEGYQASWRCEIRAAVTAYLDAAAAPAVGVSDDRNPIDILFEFGSVYHQWIEDENALGDLNRGLMHALERLGATETLASLTAQPEPGTHDDAGQPAREG